MPQTEAEWGKREFIQPLHAYADTITHSDEAQRVALSKNPAAVISPTRTTASTQTQYV